MVAKTSEEAKQFIHDKKIDVIISDIKRNGKKEGLLFLNGLREIKITTPLIFYVEFFDEKRGTPPFSFGITDDPKEMLHLILDIIERSY